jgi:hypothetical protein
VINPGFAGPPLHVHPHAEESYAVIEGHCHGNGAEAQNGSGQLALTPQRSQLAKLASPRP